MRNQPSSSSDKSRVNVHRLLTAFPFFALAALLAGCAMPGGERDSTGGASVRTHPLRRVDFRKAPELKEMADYAREFGDEMYPRVCQLVSNGQLPAPQQFDLIVKPLSSRNTGETDLLTRKVYINSDYLIRTNSAVQREMFEK